MARVTDGMTYVFQLRRREGLSDLDFSLSSPFGTHHLSAVLPILLAGACGRDFPTVISTFFVTEEQ